MSLNLNICVVEDDSLMVSTFQLLLESEKNCKYFSCLKDALSGLGSFYPHVALLDLCHPGDPTGSQTLSLISEFKQKFPKSYICIQSGIDDLAMMKSAMKSGADRYILKDSIAVEVPLLLDKITSLLSAQNQVDSMILGSSEIIKKLKKDILLLRSEYVDVLIEGETGTGKEVCARALHADGPFVAVNCSAIPKDLFESEFFGYEKGAFSGANQSKAGFFEAAESGTLFLDEIQSLSLDHQSKLLRVLEERKLMRVGSQKLVSFNARVISAANENLRDKIRKQLFREDLYFRISPLRLELAPLRARREDILVLLNSFLSLFDSSRTKKFSAEAIQELVNVYEWPGNVRQLKSLVQSLCLRSPIPIFDLDEVNRILDQDESAWGAVLQRQVPPPRDGAKSSDTYSIDLSVGLDENVSRLESQMIQDSFRNFGSTGAIEKLKISKSRFYDKIKSLKADS